MNSLASLEWFTLLEHYSAHCASAPAKQFALELEPAEELSDAQSRLDLTAEAYKVMEEGSFPFLGSLDTLDPVLDRLSKEAVLDGKELRALAKLARISAELREKLSQAENSPLLSSWAKQIVDLARPVKPIDYAIDDMGKVLDSASPVLRSLRDQERKLHSEARDKVEAVLQAAFRAGYLQEKFYDFRDGRYLIPVKTEFRNKVPGFVVENSSTKATVFMEPASVRDCNDKIKQLQLLIEEEVYRILYELSVQLFPLAQEFTSAYETVVELDLCLARGSFAQKFAQIRGVSKPEFGEHFHLEELYHPLLGFVIEPSKVIRNTLKLGPQKRVLIISGPNTGGKTVLLKAVGLSSLMARAGFFLSCAGDAKIPFCPNVLSQIGDSQNLELSLSSFSGSIVQLKEILAEGQKGSLILIDEILHATDPDEATALSRAILEDLQAKGAFAIVTTHLNGLKVADSTDFESASMEFDVEKMSPTYRLRIGVPGSSRALEIALNLGLSSTLIHKARGYLSQDRVKEQSTLDQLERQERELNAARAEMESLQTALQEEKTQFENLNADLENTKRRFRQEALEKIKLQQREAISSLDQLISKYKGRLENVSEKHEATIEAQKDITNIKESFEIIELSVDDIAPKKIVQKEALPTPTAFQKNGTVFVRSMNSEATLLSDPADKSKLAEVMIGIMRLKISWDQLEPKARPAIVAGKSGYRPQEEVDCPVEINLIGKTVDQAIDDVQSFMDRASRSGRASVRIVHGHGSGALRKAVRDFLAKCDYEMKFRTGSKQEGGEGCTVVEFI